MWIFVIAILTGLCYASLLYLYNKKQDYSKTLTVLLFTLRSTVVCLLVLLFFNPHFQNKVTKVEPATIIIAQDNSQSLILTKDSIFYKNHYPLILDTLINRLEENFTLEKYLFGNETKAFDTIDYQDYYSDFHNILNNIKKDYYKKNVGAIILLSDGICNKSYQPEQYIESYPFHIYSVTLGDTTNYPDFYIKDIQYNKTIPSNTVFPIRLTVNANNCRNKTMNIKVLKDNELIKEIEIPITSNHFSNTIDLNINSEEAGSKQIDIKIESLENEVITGNNKRRFFVEVIDKQYKVLFYGKSPHPDLGSLRNILDDHFEIETIFNDDDIPDLKDYDIVFLHQVPFSGMSNYKDLETEINKNKKLPIFYIIGEHSDFKAFNNLQKSTTIAKGAVNSVLDIRPYYNQDFGLFTIDEKTIEASNQFPPLSLPHLEFSSNSNHDMLLQMNINNILTQSPILSFSTDNEGRKNAYLFGTGIWRWKLYNFHNEKKHDIFEELFAKSIKYLLTDKDKELTINHNESFSSNEPVIFTAELKNPSQELINEPNLRILITNKHSKNFYKYEFLKRDKSYHLTINNLPEGNYQFTAQAEFGGKTYLKNGNFNIVNIGVEAQNLTANSQRMQLLASLTGGRNFNINEIHQIAEAIENDERITSITREEINYKDLINMKSLFFIILSLISSEWILRKIFGTY